MHFSTMISDAGGAFARRSRDASNFLELTSLYTTFHNLFSYSRHFPYHHCTLHLTSSTVVRDPVFTRARAPSLHQSSNQLDAVVEHYSPWVGASLLKYKSASSPEPEHNLSHAFRSMGSCCFKSLVDQRPHRRSLDAQRTLSLYGKIFAQKTLRSGLAGDRSCASKFLDLFMKPNILPPLSSTSTPAVQKPTFPSNRLPFFSPF